MDIYCPQCEHANLPSSNFCGSCGFQLSATKLDNSPFPEDPLESAKASLSVGFDAGDVARVQAAADELRKSCPHCREKIDVDALQCRWCGKAFTTTFAPRKPQGGLYSEALRAGSHDDNARGYRWTWNLVVVFFVSAITAVVLANVPDLAGAGLVFLVAGVISFVMIPGAVAHDRAHHNENAIWVVAILFGWTFLGWGIALIWACAKPPPTRH